MDWKRELPLLREVFGDAPSQSIKLGHDINQSGKLKAAIGILADFKASIAGFGGVFKEKSKYREALSLATRMGVFDAPEADKDEPEVAFAYSGLYEGRHISAFWRDVEPSAVIFFDIESRYLINIKRRLLEELGIAPEEKIELSIELMRTGEVFCLKLEAGEMIRLALCV